MSVAELDPPVRLGDLVVELGGELLGSPDQTIRTIASLDAADSGCISFLANPKYKAQLQTTQAACVIVAPAVKDEAAARGAAIVTPDPYLYFARLTQWWARRVRPQPSAQVHPSAVVDASATLAPGVTVGPLAVIESGAVVGEGAVIGPHCVVGRNARIGAHTRLSARVTVGFDCVLGARCIVHSGAVIGADGFGFAPHQGRWEKIEQLGAVHIGDDVEIGANTCIDRGALSDTVIEQGVKLDNLIQIAHNVRIGEHSAMAANVGVAGSTVIGKHCTVGGAANIIGHLELADRVHISVATTVTRSLNQAGHYTGVFPLDTHADWEKNAATVKNLAKLRERLRALEKACNKNE